MARVTFTQEQIDASAAGKKKGNVPLPATKKALATKVPTRKHPFFKPTTVEDLEPGGKMESMLVWADPTLEQAYDGMEFNKVLRPEDVRDAWYPKGMVPPGGHGGVDYHPLETITLRIAPMAAPRLTQKQVRLVHVKEEKLKRSLQAVRRRVLKYMNWQSAVGLLAAQQRFTLPDGMWRAYFYVPMPKTWPLKEKQAMWGQPCKKKPDLDNYLKALKDALKKEDASVWDEQGTKYWDWPEEARIVIQIKKSNHTL